MDLRDKNGKILSWSTIGDDVLKYHLSTSKLVKKRNLEVKTQAELLDILREAMAENKPLFSRIKKALIKNDTEEEKSMNKRKSETSKPTSKRQQPAKSKANQPTNDSKANEDSLTWLMEKKESIIAEISEEERTLQTAISIAKIRTRTVQENQVVYDKAKKALNTAKDEQKAAQKEITASEKKLISLKKLLEDTEKRIADKKASKIYLVAPNYTGDFPEFGTFVSTAEIAGADTKIECASEEFRIKPEFEDMLNAGYDSGLEYAKALQFVALIIQYIFEGKDASILVSDKRMEELIAFHIG